MKKILLILILAISANAWAEKEFNFTSSEFNLICDLNDEKSPSYKLHGYKPSQSSDKLTIHVEQGEKQRRKGSIISETLTNGKVVNLKVLLVNPHNLFFQTRRPIGRSISGNIPGLVGGDIEVRKHKLREMGDYMGLCEIAEE